MHPLDTIKTRIQAADPNVGWRQVIFSKATLRSLGKGFFVSALGAAGQGGARLAHMNTVRQRCCPKKKMDGQFLLLPYLLYWVIWLLASSRYQER